VSVAEVVTVVPSVLARVVMASAGAERYYHQCMSM